jgi:molybdopterin synthase catalytic subunit
VVFIGTVRDNSDGREVTAIEYEAYRSMAVKSLTEISERCEAVTADVRVAVAHRTGTLAIGETVVIIATAGPHRAEAFQAARSCAELMKWETAIWRKEIRPDGEEWIGAPCDLAVE